MGTGLPGQAGFTPGFAKERTPGQAQRRPWRLSGAVTVSLAALGWVMLAAGGGGLASFTELPLLLLMFAAMYFLLIAPNQKKQKQWQSQLAALKPGDRVTTTGGLRGTIVSIREDVLIVKTQPDGVKFEIVKNAIAAVTTEETAKS